MPAKKGSLERRTENRPTAKEMGDENGGGSHQSLVEEKNQGLKEKRIDVTKEKGRGCPKGWGGVIFGNRRGLEYSGKAREREKKEDKSETVSKKNHGIGDRVTVR